MEKALALLVGVAAWAGVALVAVLTVEFIGDDNQYLAALPILVAVIAAWAVGEVVTERVFPAQEAEE